jgi:hypothetical protein
MACILHDCSAMLAFSFRFLNSTAVRHSSVQKHDVTCFWMVLLLLAQQVAGTALLGRGLMGSQTLYTPSAARFTHAPVYSAQLLLLLLLLLSLFVSGR